MTASTNSDDSDQAEQHADDPDTRMNETSATADDTERFEVEVQCEWAGSTVVEAKDGDDALEIVEQLEDSEIIFNDMSPGKVKIKGVYSLD